MNFLTRYRDLWLAATAKVENDLRARLRERDEEVERLRAELATARGKLDRLELYLVPGLQPRSVTRSASGTASGNGSTQLPESSWQKTLKDHIALMEQQDAEDAKKAKEKTSGA